MFKNRDGNSHSEKRSFCCEQCGQLLASKRTLLNHLTLKHGVESPTTFPCNVRLLRGICGKLFTRKSTLSTHMAAHKGIKPFECSVCLKKFTQKVTRDVHALIHVGNHKHSCTLCSRKFPTHYKLKFHMKSHAELNRTESETNQKEVFNCSLCPLRFFSQVLYFKHKQSDHPTENPSLFCFAPDCPAKVKSFSNLNLFKKHNQRHHNPNKTFFTCDVCGSQFVEKVSLRHHFQTVHSAYPGPNYTCHLCGKMFTLKKQLRRHLKFHYEEPKFRCDVCGKRYFRLDCFKNHTRGHTLTPTTCPMCEKKFKDEISLETHKSLHLSADHVCVLCSVTFTNRTALEYHKAKHEGNYKFTCETCGKRFVRKGHLSSHLKSHKSLSVQCSVCSKLFKDVSYLKRHLKRVHCSEDEFPTNQIAFTENGKIKLHFWAWGRPHLSSV